MYPDGSTHQLVYDSRGNVITQVNANAAIIDFEHDALNQLLSKQLGSGAASVIVTSQRAGCSLRPMSAGRHCSAMMFLTG